MSASFPANLPFRQIITQWSSAVSYTHLDVYKRQATDCVTMYQMCRTGGEEPETRTYFQKIRAFSDFALEVPYNPAKIADDMNMILESLSEKETTGLLEQIAHLEEDVTKY